MRRRWRVAAIVTVLSLLGASAAATSARLLLPTPDGEVLALLLLGSDDGPPRDGDLRVARADGIQLLFVSGDRQHATFVSIPRDAYVPLSDGRTTRLNACLNGGPEPCVASVEQEFGVSLDGYLLTSMQGFRTAVEAFGGLTVDVPTPVFDGGHPIEEAGRQHLTGAQALTYARDRNHRPDGDFDRSEAQAELLALAHAEVAAGGVDAALAAVTVLRQHVITDLGGSQLARLAMEALRLPPDNVDRVLAPGYNTTIGDAAVVRLRDDAYDLIVQVARDGRLDPDRADGADADGADADGADADRVARAGGDVDEGP